MTKPSSGGGIRIDNLLLSRLGYSDLEAHQKKRLLKWIYESLERRVGERLAERMTETQLDEFERLFDAKDDQGAFSWLSNNFPEYKLIVRQQFMELKQDLCLLRPRIRATMLAVEIKVG